MRGCLGAFQTIASDGHLKMFLKGSIKGCHTKKLNETNKKIAFLLLRLRWRQHWVHWTHTLGKCDIPASRGSLSMHCCELTPWGPTRNVKCVLQRPNYNPPCAVKPSRHWGRGPLMRRNHLTTLHWPPMVNVCFPQFGQNQNTARKTKKRVKGEGFPSAPPRSDNAPTRNDRLPFPIPFGLVPTVEELLGEQGLNLSQRWRIYAWFHLQNRQTSSVVFCCMYLCTW